MIQKEDYYMIRTAFQAEEYDSKIKQTLPYYEDFYNQITDILDVLGKSKTSWLDIGCGTGRMYEVAQRKLSLNEFVFTDISDKMLEISRERFPAKENRFEVMAAQELAENGKYDVITAVQVNHYLSEEEREVAVRNCYQALKSDGVFFTYENVAPNSAIGKEIGLKRWQKYQIENGKSQEEATGHIKRYKTEYFPITIKSHLEMMARSGFQSVELIWMSYMQAGFMGIK